MRQGNHELQSVHSCLELTKRYFIYDERRHAYFNGSNVCRNNYETDRNIQTFSRRPVVQHQIHIN